MWTLDTMTDAEAKHQFVMVTQGATPRVNITEAHQLWALNPTIVFATGYRIAGTPEDIRAALTANQIPEDHIQALLDASISRGNYNRHNVVPAEQEAAPEETTKWGPQTLPNIYDEELESYNTYMRAAVKANAEAPGAKLFDVMTTVNPTVFQTARNTREGFALGIPAKAPGAGAARGRGRTAEPLDTKLAKLDANKVLDVSKLNPDGTGARGIELKPNARKYGSPDLPIVSADLEHYLLAIDMMAGGRQHYASAVQYVQQLFAGAGAPAAPATPAYAAPAQPVAQPIARSPFLAVGNMAPPPVAQPFGQPFTQFARPVQQAQLVQPAAPVLGRPMFPAAPRAPASPLFQGVPAAQTEMIVPTKTFPTFTKAQRDKQKKANVAVATPFPVGGMTPFPAGGMTPFPTGGLANIGATEFEDDDDDDDDNLVGPVDYDDEFDDDEDGPNDHVLPAGYAAPATYAPATYAPPAAPFPQAQPRVAFPPAVPQVQPRTAFPPAVPQPRVPFAPAPMAYTPPAVPQVQPRTAFPPAVPQVQPRTPVVPMVAPRTPVVPTGPFAPLQPVATNPMFQVARTPVPTVPVQPAVRTPPVVPTVAQIQPTVRTPTVMPMPQIPGAAPIIAPIVVPVVETPVEAPVAEAPVEVVADALEAPVEVAETQITEAPVA